MTLEWRDVPLDRTHDRKAFNCGEPALDEYLQKYARQNHESGGAKTFVAIDVAAPTAILGFYTLSPASIDYARTPAVVRRGLGRYEVPVFRLGRLAVAMSMQGRGLGAGLLLAAGRRCLAVSDEVGGVALLIDAKSERAAKWYEGFGAVRLADARAAPEDHRRGDTARVGPGPIWADSRSRDSDLRCRRLSLPRIAGPSGRLANETYAITIT